MEERVAKLERQVRALSWLTSALVFVAIIGPLWISLLAWPFSNLRLSSSVFGTTTLAAGRLQIARTDGDVTVDPAGLRFKPSGDREAGFAGALDHSRLWFSLDRTNVPDDSKTPVGSAAAGFSVSADPQWDRYGAALYMADELGKSHGAGNSVSLATNVHGAPSLELRSHNRGRIVLRFDEQGEPLIHMKASDGRERKIGFGQADK